MLYKIVCLVQSKQVDLMILQILINISVLDMVLALITRVYLSKYTRVIKANMSGSVHASNKTQNILALGKAFMQKINNTTIYADKMYSPNFSVENKIFVLSLHYNSDNSYLFVNSQKVTQFKAKNSEIKANRMFLGSLVGSKAYYDASNLSKDGINNTNNIV